MISMVMELSSSDDSEDEILTFTLASSIKPTSKSKIELPPTIPREPNVLSSALDPGIDIPETYLSTFPHRNPAEATTKVRHLVMKSAREELLKKSVIHRPGFEKRIALPPLVEGRRKIRKRRLQERDKTAGAKWFNMPIAEMTEESKNDLMVLQMRKALDPKHFYKRSTMKTLPKYFQVGTVIESPADFYHSRIPKRQRKKTLVDELLADAEFRQYQKRKYNEILAQQPEKVYHTKKKKSRLSEVRQNDSKKKVNKKKKH